MVGHKEDHNQSGVLRTKFAKCRFEAKYMSCRAVCEMKY